MLIRKLKYSMRYARTSDIYINASEQTQYRGRRAAASCEFSRYEIDMKF